MKLIIDIPDKGYEKLKDGHIPFSILDVMQNGIPLEDIKTEILKVQYRIDDSTTLSTRDVVNVEDIEDIIEKHIGGEENEE